MKIRLLVTIAFIALMNFVAPVAAQTSEENKQALDELRNIAHASGQMGPTKTTGNGNLEYRSLILNIGEMYVNISFFKDTETGEYVRCDISHKYGDNAHHLYHNLGCDGQASQLDYKNGKWSQPRQLTDGDYATVLRSFRQLLILVRDLNKNVANARLTILYDNKNVQATRQVMQNMVYTFEGFPEFNSGEGFIVSENDISLGSIYRFPVRVENYGFMFLVNVRPDKGYDDCLFKRLNVQGLERSWLDRDCNGSFEAFSEHGDGNFRIPPDEGSHVALMMYGFMRQTLNFMQAYENLLKLPLNN